MRKFTQNKLEKSDIAFLWASVQVGAAGGLGIYAIGSVLEIFPASWAKYTVEASFTAAVLISNAWRMRTKYLDLKEAEDFRRALDEEEDSGDNRMYRGH